MYITIHVTTLTLGMSVATLTRIALRHYAIGMYATILACYTMSPYYMYVCHHTHAYCPVSPYYA
jgi:hypothetical protein